MLTQSQYAETCARLAAYDEWAEQFRKPNGWTLIPAEAAQNAPVKVTNEERSAIEVFEFMRDKPERLFAYVKLAPDGNQLTTWTGDNLGRLTVGTVWKSGFGDKRLSIRVTAINGETYSGTGFGGNGMFARLRKVKRKAA